MKKRLFAVIILCFFMVNMLGCAPLIVGAAVGALGGYAASKDTIQGETDKPYDGLWDAALAVAKIRGNLQQEDYSKGHIEAGVESSLVWIKLVRLTRATTRLKVSSRKYHLPNLSLAQDIYVKIMEQVK